MADPIGLATVAAVPAPAPGADGNEPLVTRIRAFSAAGAVVALLANDIVQQLNNAALEFNLAPDEMADVRRLPRAVVDLTTLIAYLRTIKGKLATRDAKVETKNWVVATSGELRLYKTFVCCLNGMSRYLGVCTNAQWMVPLGELVTAMMRWCSTNPPEALSKAGTKLWSAVFESGTRRTIIALKTILSLCIAVPAAPPDDPDDGDDGN